MRIAQITLTDQQAQALRSLAQRQGKAESAVIAEAIDQLMTQHSQTEHNAAWQQAKGMWQNRPDLPDSRVLREESSRYAALTQATPTPLTALRYDIEITDEGRMELRVPFSQGAHVVVYVIEEPSGDAFEDLLAASSTSLDFWDNALDDEDWNHA